MSRFWKEASSVIIAARISFPQCTVSYPVGTVNKPNKNAVSAQKIGSERLCSPNFKVLALRRSSKNSFFPDTYVFPGGSTDAADSSQEWLDLYDQYGLGKCVFEIATSLPRQYSKINIFEGQREDEILKSISLRITGIRETFEESGVLLCKSKRAHTSQPSRWGSYLTGHEIKNWQRKVQEDANEFINLCRHFECYPDIWSLQEWSNWLTPSDYTRRFNTIFFLTTLDQMPTAASSSSEINELKWSTPEEMLELCYKQEIILPPPQFYELSRLITFGSIENLADFAVQKNSTGSELWMPVRQQTLDGEVTLLPGDDMYPKEPIFSPTSKQKVESSILDYQRQSHHLHRMEHTKEYHTRLVVSNIKPHQSEILPWVAPI